MFSRLFYALLTALVAVFSSPVAHAGLFDGLDLDGVKKRQQVYESVLDKQLVDHFYVIADGGKADALVPEIPKSSGFKFVKLTEGSFIVKRLRFTGDNLGDIVAEMREYAYSPLDDEMGKRYAAFAQSRGNSVKLYKPALGELIGNIFERHLEFKPAGNVATFPRSENALIEHAPDGRIVSVMVRTHQAIHNFNARSWQYVMIVSGERFGRLIENKIPNSAFEQTLLRELPALQ